MEKLQKLKLMHKNIGVACKKSKYMLITNFDKW